MSVTDMAVMIRRASPGMSRREVFGSTGNRNRAGVKDDTLGHVLRGMK